MSRERKEELAKRAADLVRHAFTAGWQTGIKHAEGAVKLDRPTPSSLLERFVDLYGETPLVGSMIEPGMRLWRDYYGWIGDHMILTDEGWEPGSEKPSYEAMAATENVPLSDLILDEVNIPQ